ncbi:unnamed protein product, partial [Prorocentrum cordatum]
MSSYWLCGCGGYNPFKLQGPKGANGQQPTQEAVHWPKLDEKGIERAAALSGEAWAEYRKVLAKATVAKVDAGRAVTAGGPGACGAFAAHEATQHFKRVDQKAVEAAKTVQRLAAAAAKATLALEEAQRKCKAVEAEREEARAAAAKVFVVPEAVPAARLLEKLSAADVAEKSTQDLLAEVIELVKAAAPPPPPAAAAAAASPAAPAGGASGAEGAGPMDVTVEAPPPPDGMVTLQSFVRESDPGSTWRGPTINPNAHSTFMDLVGKDELVHCDFVAVQETHLSTPRAAEAGAAFDRLGWHALACAATDAEGGTPGHGGLHCLAPRRHGAAPFLVDGLRSGELIPGRAAILHHGGFMRGGISWVNVYLHTGGGLSAANLAILEAVRRAVLVVGPPLIICGDFNMEPVELAQAPWLAQLGGHIVAPASGTCRPAERVLYYFVVSSCFAAAKATTLQDWDFGPHRPVLLEVSTGQVQPWVQVTQSPKPFPRPPTPGSCSQDFGPAWAAVQQAAPHAPTVDDAWQAVISVAEDELIDRCGLSEHGDQYRGRAAPPVLRWARASAPKMPRYPRLDIQMCWIKQWAMVAKNASSLDVIGAHGRGRQQIHRLRRAWNRYVRHADGGQQQSRLGNALALLCSAFDYLPCAALRAVAALVDDVGDLLVASAIRRTKSKFGDWIEQQAMLEGGALHAFTKEPTQWHPSPTCADGGSGAEGNPVLTPADQMQAAQLLVKEWSRYWNIGSTT